MLQKSNLKRSLAALGLCIIVMLPGFLLSGYQLFVLSMIAVHTAAALGLNLLTGYTGQISVGHGGLMAIGAYSFAILTTKLPGIPLVPAILAAAVLTAIAGLCLGIPAVRLSGPYLAIVTIGFAISVPQLLLHFSDVTGGRQGIMVDKPIPPDAFASHISSDQWTYIISVFLVLALYGGARAIAEGSLGRTFLAVADSELAAKSVGINVAANKVIVFVISAFYTGVAGALYCGNVGFVSSESFPLMTSVALLTMVVIGGLRSLGGSFLGAALITLLPNLSSQVSKSMPGIVYGACLIGVVLFSPTGIGGLASKIYTNLRKWSRLRTFVFSR